VVEGLRKSAQCARCPHRIDLSAARRHFTSLSAEEARAFIGAANRKAVEGRRRGGGAPAAAGELAPAGPTDPRAQELRRIGEGLGAARGPAGRLRAILRKGFEAFGELTPEDLDEIARAGDLEESGEELAEAAVDQGLAARGRGGSLIPLREGK
jgi:hypothetical protein